MLWIVILFIFHNLMIWDFRIQKYGMREICTLKLTTKQIKKICILVIEPKGKP